ncbi:putative mucin TcMUCII [Trypanosoma cruzi]|uniref:Mucin TcMUCII, putative n=1 Tax=Trypanosoma cruzi (strain CL Brener) TaxID=353153 RepID=Q4D8D5_TRYCC|nr:mucin TcMUCII, putative [Trypanosoma cruzi]EAN88787.1 mucin TcMUCII, putative [Trypanosoma cruzi]KAF8280101.1 putative mucin TcMUCII [Trypanosoma cruzi]RNC54020.1 mucin TcMUCII [Trypanosoma cruzi]|eukprot:XP_810638.1 mucin TcMUCII [Trypanosoma cruzi strain CL Brener]
MMTCRLLCALLVLALCCRLSVGATAQDPDSLSPSPEVKGVAGAEGGVGTGGSIITPGTSGAQNQDDESREGSGVGHTSESSSERPTQLDRQDATVTDKTPHTSNSAVSTGPGPGAPLVTVERPAASEAPSNSEHKPNATTTTTTTTTTAPEAPSSTAMNTETPTTTTTHAPSRLREIDGSLSSSAWVCAPLVLAVSALAYTALG